MSICTSWRFHPYTENVERVEVLPYHTLAFLNGKSWDSLSAEGVKPPTQERIDNARRFLGRFKSVKESK
ncbi:MAG: hypothetical protein ACLT4D_07970 [Blautia faecis]